MRMRVVYFAYMYVERRCAEAVNVKFMCLFLCNYVCTKRTPDDVNGKKNIWDISTYGKKKQINKRNKRFGHIYIL